MNGFLRRAGEGTGNRGHVLLSRGLIPRVCGDPEGTASARRNDQADRQEGTDGSGLQTAAAKAGPVQEGGGPGRAWRGVPGPHSAPAPAPQASRTRHIQGARDSSRS